MPQDKKITSVKNPNIKKVVDLREPKVRRTRGLTIIEGVREVRLAKKAGIEFKELYLCPEILRDKGFQNEKELVPNGVETFELTKDVFQKISFGERNEGVVAVAQIPHAAFKDLKLSPASFLLVVENVEKPGNLGAILRTCDACGVDGVILSDAATDAYNPNVIRASLGAVFSVKVIEGSTEETLSFLKANKIKIFAASVQGKTVYTKADLKGPLAFIVGSEDEGLSPFWLSHADEKIHIPMRGKTDSLNVSASTAVLLYETIRQRSAKN